MKRIKQQRSFSNKLSQIQHLPFPLSFVFVVTLLHILLSAAATDIQKTRTQRSAIYQRNEGLSQPALTAVNFVNRYTGQKLYNLYSVLPPTTATNAKNHFQTYNLLQQERVDICKYCTCDSSNKFRSVTCDYRKNPMLNRIFNAFFNVTHDVTSITIYLAANTEFQLQQGFFYNNMVNNLKIVGNDQNEQVEITENAFYGNAGGFPDIHIRNIKSLFVRNRAFSSGEIKLRVQNCAEVVLYTDAFINVNMYGTFSDIRDMRIHDKAFNSAHAKLRIINTFIGELTRFEASLHEIRFINCTIGIIKSSTFNVTNINFIEFQNSRIGSIETHAITDKLHSESVWITGATIGTIDSEAIHGSGISDLILKDNVITSIKSKAISVTSVNVTIARNNITHLGDKWLAVNDWANIVMVRNKFGEFGAMSLATPKQPANCSFISNSLTKPAPGSLNLNNCQIHEISIKLPCMCNLTWLDMLSSEHDLRSETYCAIDQNLSYCFNATTFNTLKYINEVCDETKDTLNCVANRNVKRVNNNFFTPEELEQKYQNPNIKIIIMIILGIVSIFSAFAMLYCLVMRCKSKDMSLTNENSHNGSGGSSNINGIAGNEHLHEFTDEDHRIIKQSMALLQKNHPKIHGQVQTHINRLLKPDLPEPKCTKAIEQIENLMAGANSDFIPFNRVLSQHLQQRLPSAPPQPDPIYSDPDINAGTGINIGNLADKDYYTSALIRTGNGTGNNAMPMQMQMPLPNPNSNPNTNNNAMPLPEHIYAVPNCPQQPLLHNEYASPADRCGDTLYFYSEPINERDPNNALPAYEVRNLGLPQYATPKRLQPPPQQQLLPSSNYISNNNNNNNNSNNHLPMSVFHVTKMPLTAAATTTTTSVRQLAKKLAAKPEFHPNQLSSMQNQRHLFFTGSGNGAANGNGNGNGNGNNRNNNDNTNKSNSSLSSNSFDELDMRGAVALETDSGSGSNHSGGSNETVKIDDVIEYADA